VSDFSPTPPPLIRLQLEELASGLREVLGDRLVGVYVHGSLALGCFNPRRSDLDVIAVAEGGTSDGERLRLASLFAAPAERPLELHLLRRDDLHPWRHRASFELHWHGDLVERSPGGDRDLAAHVTVARAVGIALLGPPPRELLPEVPRADYLDALRRDLAWTREHGNELYVVLSPLRVRAALESGELHSKASGAEWAMGRLPPDLRPLVERAHAAYTGSGTFETERAELERLLAFVEARVAS
jgi:predicted nucleotidyltransferase